jgi:DNA-binding MarR family transcriptional regulator
MDAETAQALNAAVRRISIRHRARAAELLGDLGLYPGQEAVLQLLEAQGPQTQAALARGASCEPPTIAGVVRHLEAAGLVARAPSSADARVRVVSLTQAGKALLPRLHQAWVQLGRESTAGLRHTTPAALVNALEDLAHSLETDTSPAGRRRQ